MRFSMGEKGWKGAALPPLLASDLDARPASGLSPASPQLRTLPAAPVQPARSHGAPERPPTDRRLTDMRRAHQDRQSRARRSDAAQAMLAPADASGPSVPREADRIHPSAARAPATVHAEG